MNSLKDEGEIIINKDLSIEGEVELPVETGHIFNSDSIMAHHTRGCGGGVTTNAVANWWGWSRQ